MRFWLEPFGLGTWKAGQWAGAGRRPSESGLAPGWDPRCVGAVATHDLSRPPNPELGLCQAGSQGRRLCQSCPRREQRAPVGGPGGLVRAQFTKVGAECGEPRWWSHSWKKGVITGTWEGRCREGGFERGSDRHRQGAGEECSLPSWELWPAVWPCGPCTRAEGGGGVRMGRLQPPSCCL